MIDAAAHGLSTAGTAAQNQSALSDSIATAAGGTVLVAAGTYQVAPVVIRTPHTHLQFAPGAVLQVPPDTALRPTILDIRADHVSVEGGQFDGSGIAGNSSICAIRIYGSPSHVRIRNCVVRNASTGIGSWNACACEDWTIEGCTVETTVHGHGIFLHGNPQLLDAVRGVRVQNNSIAGTKGNGIWIGNHVSDVTIFGNKIVNSGRMGIEVWRNPDGRYAISGNSIAGCGSFGISICATPRTSCADNNVTGATFYGIEIANSRFVALTGNHIADVQGKDTGQKPVGITCNSPDDYKLGDISIVGGSILGCHTAINLCGDLGMRENITITGVVIRDCEYGARNVGHIGERAGGGKVQNIAITGCTIYVTDAGISNSYYGGLMRGGVMSGNNIYVSEGNGIDLFRAAEMLIVGNRICGADAPGQVGITLRDHDAGALRAHDLMVENNLILHCESDTVYHPRIAGEMAA